MTTRYVGLQKAQQQTRTQLYPAPFLPANKLLLTVYLFLFQGVASQALRGHGRARTVSFSPPPAGAANLLVGTKGDIENALIKLQNALERKQGSNFQERLLAEQEKNTKNAATGAATFDIDEGDLADIQDSMDHFTRLSSKTMHLE